MHRRTLLKGTALIGLGALAGTSYWLARPLQAPSDLSLEGALSLLDSLEGQALLSAEGFSPAETFNHCAQSIEYSLQGYPELKPAWFRQTVGPAALALFQWRGAMHHPLDEPIPGAQALNEPADVAQALARLRAAFTQFAAFSAPLAPHFAYGQLTHEQYARAHVMHLYNHMSLIRRAT